MGQACDGITVLYVSDVITSLECAGGWGRNGEILQDKVMKQRGQTVILLLNNSFIHQWVYAKLR